MQRRIGPAAHARAGAAAAPRRRVRTKRLRGRGPARRLNCRSAAPAAARFPGTAATPRTAGMRLQRRIAIVEQRGMGLADKTQHAGDRDIGMADRLAEPVRRLDRGALLFQHVEHARYLRLAALDPQIELPLLAQHALVQQADALVAEPHRQRADPQLPSPRLARSARSSPSRDRRPRRDDPGSSRSRSAPRRHPAPASAPAAADYTARSCRHRRRSTTAGVRTADHRAAAQWQRGGRRGSRIGRSGT